MSIQDFGQRNIIKISDRDLARACIIVYGDDNFIDIQQLFQTKGKITIIIFGSFCSVCLGKSLCVSSNLKIRIGKNEDNKINNVSVTIGKKTSIEDMEIITFNSNNKIIIGEECMISYNVLIYNTDGHPVYDRNSKKIINRTKNLTIGSHTWIGAYSKILKNSFIPPNNIIGMGSVVSKKFKKQYSVIAGNPAKVVKKDVDWAGTDSKYIQNRHFDYTQYQVIDHSESPYLLNVYVLTYNHEKTISKTLDSILEQKTDFPFIITILEDCSTDNTLKICHHYQKQYPNKINIIAQPVNTNAEHSRWAKEKINTKYWCTIEGDDYWCDQNKIQTALEILEENENYIGFAHDTLCINMVESREFSLHHNDIEHANTGHRSLLTFSNLFYVHTSAVIYRHIVDFKTYKLPIIDTYILYYHISFGPIYYYDKIMSCHPQTGYGMWSSLSQKQRDFNNEFIHYTLNKELKYKFDKKFSQTVRQRLLLKTYKKLFGKNIGWKIYISSRYIILQIYKFWGGLK